MAKACESERQRLIAQRAMEQSAVQLRQPTQVMMPTPVPAIQQVQMMP